MDWLNTFMDYAYPVIVLLCGLLVTIYKTREDLKTKIPEKIREVEADWEGLRHKGIYKGNDVVNALYELIPIPLRPLFPKSVISILVKNTFTQIEEYAKLQAGKVIDKYVTEINPPSE